ncbi:MAG: hypothetical protein LBC61_02015 [Candidatus Peribacteria bacterium]|nr:hypothetical protein [Candidatus Peribacteria bacterium]
MAVSPNLINLKISSICIEDKLISSNNSLNFSLLILFFLSISHIVSFIFSIQILSKNQLKNFLLFMFI